MELIMINLNKVASFRLTEQEYNDLKNITSILNKSKTENRRTNPLIKKYLENIADGKQKNNISISKGDVIRASIRNFTKKYKQLTKI
jgi:hypothetical protein|tara:strand:+ start:491 stop:751 length:261 start_codon:yes stop_codon:yes gene_type:complete